MGADDELGRLVDALLTDTHCSVLVSARSTNVGAPLVV
jgi:hypothetical protein